MKFDLTEQLMDLNGNPASQTVANGFNLDGTPKGLNEIPLTFGLVIKTALNNVNKEKPIGLEKSVKRGRWIMSINNNTCPDFKVEELSEIKSAVLDAGFAPIIVAQIDEIIERKDQ